MPHANRPSPSFPSSPLSFPSPNFSFPYLPSLLKIFGSRENISIQIKNLDDSLKLQKYNNIKSFWLCVILASASITCCFRVKPQILQGCSSPFCLDDIKGKTNLRNQVRVACFALGMRDGGGVRGNNWILKNY